MTGERQSTNFGLADAVGVLQDQTNVANNLWTVYVLATFAAATFGADYVGKGTTQTITILVGFWLFAFGNLTLLVDSLEARRHLSGTIITALESGPPGVFDEAIRNMTHGRRFVVGSILVHLAIIACFTLFLLSRAGALS